jgi:hypothetical protein
MKSDDEIKKRYENQLKETNEKYDKIFYDDLKIGLISSIIFYTVLKIMSGRHLGL